MYAYILHVENMPLARSASGHKEAGVILSKSGIFLRIFHAAIRSACPTKIAHADEKCAPW
jgi:hypothetical protein